MIQFDLICKEKTLEEKKLKEIQKQKSFFENELGRINFLINNISWKICSYAQRSFDLNDLTKQRNKLNRKIATLKKANLKN